jgi:putative CocE/NonD family hydrolase
VIDIYLPKGEGPFPTILIRSPYNKNNSKVDAEKFNNLDYAVVIQDTRGKYESDGQFYPFKYERKDGLATINWIKSQKWCNGKIRGWGEGHNRHPESRLIIDPYAHGKILIKTDFGDNVDIYRNREEIMNLFAAKLKEKNK